MSIILLMAIQKTAIFGVPSTPPVMAESHARRISSRFPSTLLLCFSSQENRSDFIRMAGTQTLSRLMSTFMK